MKWVDVSVEKICRDERASNEAKKKSEHMKKFSPYYCKREKIFLPKHEINEKNCRHFVNHELYINEVESRAGYPESTDPESFW